MCLNVAAFWQVRQPVKSQWMLNFQNIHIYIDCPKWNLLDSHCWFYRKHYHVVLCKNVLQEWWDGLSQWRAGWRRSGQDKAVSAMGADWGQSVVSSVFSQSSYSPQSTLTTHHLQSGLNFSTLSQDMECWYLQRVSSQESVSESFT